MKLALYGGTFDPIHRAHLTVAAEAADLWERFEQCEQGNQRLHLLRKLSEADKGNKEKIRNLIAAEKKFIKRKYVQGRLSMLPNCVIQGDWSTCFDIVKEICRLEDNDELVRQALSASPWFTLLCSNPRLDRLPEQKAKELWLDFIMVKQAMLAGRYEGCLECMDGLKEYFRTSPQFKEDYRTLREFERDKARVHVDTLLARLSDPGYSLAEAHKAAAALRGPMSLLPEEERAHCERELAELLRQREPQPAEDPLWEEYRKALLTGNESKAESVKDRFEDAEARERIEAEVREKFRVGRQPIKVSVGGDLTVEPAGRPSPLTWVGASERYVFMSESDHALIIVDLAEMTGARLTSPNFRDPWLMDAIPERGVFLFLEGDEGERMWRLVITETECRFTAVIVFGDDLCLQADGDIYAVYLCGENSSEYFASIDSQDPTKPARMIRQNLNQNYHPRRTYKIRGEFQGTCRLSSSPDRFMIGGKKSIIVDEELKSLGGSALLPYCVDHVEKTLYAIREGRVCLFGTKLELLKDFTSSHAAEIFYHCHVFSICKGADVVMARVEDTVSLYNLRIDRFAVDIDNGDMLFGKVWDKWFQYRYDESASTLVLKDITGDLDTLFKWEAMFRPGMDKKTVHKNWCKITGEDPLDKKNKRLYDID